jgi:hypothetical protein
MTSFGTAIPTRQTTPLHRRLLTDHLLIVLESTGKPVGDSVSPPEGGWQGEPNTDGTNFVPYVVLMPGAGTLSSGPFGDTQADWQLGYTVVSFGVSRSQVEWMADTARSVLVAMERVDVDLNGDQFRVLQARETVIGPVQRVDATQPSYYGQTDSVTLWISKELFR